MEIVVEIFKQLGADESLLHQFIIVVVMFFVTKMLFFNHLKNVILTREERTVKLAGNAEKQFEEINKIQNDYKEKIQKAHKEIKSQNDEKKSAVVKTEEAKYRAQEKEINDFIESSRKKAEAEINEKKDGIMKDAENLASELVNKIAKGL